MTCIHTLACSIDTSFDALVDEFDLFKVETIGMRRNASLSSATHLL